PRTYYSDLHGSNLKFNGYCAPACFRTSSITAQVLSISASVNVGCTRNIRLVSPSCFATGKRSAGRQSVPSKAFSRYTSEQEPWKQGTPRATISLTIISQ